MNPALLAEDCQPFQQVEHMEITTKVWVYPDGFTYPEFSLVLEVLRRANQCHVQLIQRARVGWQWLVALANHSPFYMKTTRKKTRLCEYNKDTSNSPWQPLKISSPKKEKNIVISQGSLDPYLPGFFRLVQANKAGQATSDLPEKLMTHLNLVVGLVVQSHQICKFPIIWQTNAFLVPHEGVTGSQNMSLLECVRKEISDTVQLVPKCKLARTRAMHVIAFHSDSCSKVTVPEDMRLEPGR
ncbi:hypothetical protein K435DRAFT_800843 [Dendrothele bispora CBS 962.96]|uniref:Uncharacterized protein n=1 Tax=Dendrothele bispora (strain CBS 962.96) TaxID=1314807 RepID=A0A4S8LRC4_DENBC|nr:hypothetical protein K435DRAFT_800843 [Dendrothele bispora CBS 962.96]